MDTAVIKPEVWHRWKQSHRMALLAAFEDSSTGTRVKDFCKSLSRDLGSRCRITEHVWLFNTFRLRELQEIAAEEASASDLIVIAAHRAGSLPDEVTSWIDLWLRQEVKHPGVLVALLDSAEDDTPNPVQTYLQGVAKRGGMEFLVDSSEGSDSRWHSE
jgi:hypothetical protein